MYKRTIKENQPQMDTFPTSAVSDIHGVSCSFRACDRHRLSIVLCKKYFWSFQVCRREGVSCPAWKPGQYLATRPGRMNEGMIDRNSCYLPVCFRQGTPAPSQCSCSPGRRGEEPPGGKGVLIRVINKTGGGTVDYCLQTEDITGPVEWVSESVTSQYQAVDDPELSLNPM